MTKLFAAGSLFWAFLTFSHQASARILMLNGTDISSARNQNLENVNIRIDALGNVYIEAPHYSVHQENTFLPLGHNPPSAQNARHKMPGAVSSELSQAQGQMLPKAQQIEPKAADVSPPDSPIKAEEPKLAPKEGDRVPPAN